MISLHEQELTYQRCIEQTNLEHTEQELKLRGYPNASER